MKYYQLLLLIAIGFTKLITVLHLGGHNVEVMMVAVAIPLGIISILIGGMEKFTKKVEF